MQSANKPYDEEHAGGSLDQGELLELLELRETLEGCRDQDEARDILAQAQRTRGGILRDIAAAFRAGNLDRVRHEMDSLKFYETVIEAAETRCESLG